MASSNPLDILYVAIGSAFFGSALVTLYNRFLVNGKTKYDIQIEIINKRLDNIEAQLREVKQLVYSLLTQHEKERG